MSRFCVIIEGQLRGSQRCGPNMRQHLINPLGADLIIYAQHTPEYDAAECAGRYGPAVYYRAYENPTPDFSDIFDAMRAEYGYDFNWRDTFKMIKSSNYHLGFKQPGTCIRRMYNRHLIHQLLQSIGADYDWYIVTRSDMYFVSDFPIDQCTDPNLLYSANGGRWWGINNNLLVFGAPLRKAALNYITLFLDGSIARLGNQGNKPFGMGEEMFFSRAMGLQNVHQADIRHNWFISADSLDEITTWKNPLNAIKQHPSGLLYKYQTEFERAHKQAGCPIFSSAPCESNANAPREISLTPPPSV